ncbi:ABC transporter ATP-binding protein [Dermatophilus congolensis]|uniref:ABC transporter ATP-binding protein n=1 Tax=Dermatophilus congolensis TaxID=1863 RepID=UPI001AAE9585|nr:ABC transporter ATP-binding protein [Dermatophilus congolensis]
MTEEQNTREAQKLAAQEKARAASAERAASEAKPSSNSEALVGGVFSMRSGKSAKTGSIRYRGEKEQLRDNTGRTDLAVSVQHLHITYRTTFERVPTFKNAIVRAGRGERAVIEVNAINDISFDVPNGTAIGIIGANGAGKSTLLRAIAGILPPNHGQIEVWGRASTLLALGVGFNGMLSGRENIILGGLASGLSRAEVEERAEEVAEWAELGAFIDAPMRTYSSGMYSRLAFAVAVHMKPDILMIDEALSTGDATFRAKANAKMAELRASARAMFLVSHGLSSIKEMCNDAIWLHKGRIMMHASPEECIDAYTEFVKVGKTPATMDEI